MRECFIKNTAEQDDILLKCPKGQLSNLRSPFGENDRSIMLFKSRQNTNTIIWQYRY